MSQLNFYVPDELEQKIRRAAKLKRKTISAFLAELVKSQFEKKDQEGYFSQFFGTWEGDVPEEVRIVRGPTTKRNAL
jgi:hypothetical protein